MNTSTQAPPLTATPTQSKPSLFTQAKLPFLKGGIWFIDNTNYDTIMQCERQGFFRTVIQREKVGESNALNFGGACHAALDVRYKAGGFALESIAGQIDAGVKYLSEHPTSDGDFRTAEYLGVVMNGYARQYPTDEFAIAILYNEPAVELPFAVPLGEITLSEPTLMPVLELDAPNPDGLLTALDYAKAKPSEGHISLRMVDKVPVMWTGKIDMVISKDGDLWLLDHKTASQFGDTYFEGFHLASQFRGYAYALLKSLGQQVKGVCVNVLAIRKPTATGKGVTFHRGWLPIEPQEVDEWHKNTLTQLSAFLNTIVSGVVPMRTSACRTKWHSNCPYLGVCTLPPESRELYINTGDFRNVEWSPLTANE